MDTAFWVWGRHPVAEALELGRVDHVLMAAGVKQAPVLQQIEDIARRKRVALRLVPSHEIDRIAPDQNAQGVVAHAHLVVHDDVESLLSDVAPESVPFLLVLDQVQDPHNAGALLRTASAAGVHGVVMSERRTVPLTGVVAKASAGALWHTPIAAVTNIARTLDVLRDAGLWVVGLAGDARQSIYTVDFREPTALVVGGEERGLRRLTREKCDVLAQLPMNGAVESLNASVAGALAMYEVTRQRMQTAIEP